MLGAKLKNWPGAFGTRSVRAPLAGSGGETSKNCDVSNTCPAPSGEVSQRNICSDHLKNGHKEMGGAENVRLLAGRTIPSLETVLLANHILKSSGATVQLGLASAGRTVCAFAIWLDASVRRVRDRI